MKLLKQLYQIASPSGDEKTMIEFLEGILNIIPDVTYTIDTKGNIYVIKGKNDTYPCIVAHIDEVHQRQENGYKIVTLKKSQIIFGFNSVLMDFCGIGADDKNGIWICLQCLLKYKAIKCAFFVDEERGCCGSRVANMDFFEDCQYVLQCDRKGNKDLITTISGTELCSKQFIKAIDCQKYNYKIANGLMTDVMTLKLRRLKVSCVNIACGYYNPHEKNEFTSIPDLLNCLNFVSHIIEKCKQVYPHKYAYSPSKLLKNKSWHSKGKKTDFSEAYRREYEQMAIKMTELLTGNPSMKFIDAVKLIYIDFYLLRYSDYKMVYDRIMGLPEDPLCNDFKF